MKGSGKNRTAMTWLLFLAGLVLAGLLASTLGRSASATHAAAGEQLLPDLVTLSPSSSIQIANPKRKTKELRFAYTAKNAGTGVLELTWASEDCDGDGVARNDRTAIQRIFIDSSASSSNGFFDRNDDTAFVTHRVGCFVFHPKHHHWHLEDFAKYELFDYSSGSRGDVVGTTDKVSFCIRDNSRVLPPLPGSPASPHFGTCNRDTDQGLSVGWADGYAAQLEGQSIALGSSAEGSHCLVQTADPMNHIAESNESVASNEEGTQVTISGTNASGGGPC